MFSQPQERLFLLSTDLKDSGPVLLRAGPRGESIALVLTIKSRALSNQQAKKAGGDTAGLGGVAWVALKKQRIPLATRR